MRPFLIAIALASAAVISPADAAPPTPEDQTVLEALAARNDAAWNAADAAAISAQYSEDGSLRLSGMTEALTGRAAVHSYFERSFAQRPPGLRHVSRLQRIEMVAPDLAFADAHVRVETLQEGRWQLAREFVNHSLLRREAGGWRLHSVRAHRLR